MGELKSIYKTKLKSAFPKRTGLSHLLERGLSILIRNRNE